MRRSVELVVLLLLVIGNIKTAHAKAASGVLTITAQVQTSAMWVQETDGKWKLVVANAADPVTTFVAGGGRRKSAHAQTERKSVPASKTVPTKQDSVSHGGS